MIDLVIAALVIAGIVAIYVAADRRRVIAVCTIERGRVRVVRGRLAPAVLAEITDVAQRMKIARATVEVRKESGLAAVRVKGVVDERAGQQLRNVIGRFQLSQLKG